MPSIGEKACGREHERFSHHLSRHLNILARESIGFYVSTLLKSSVQVANAPPNFPQISHWKYGRGWEDRNLLLLMEVDTCIMGVICRHVMHGLHAKHCLRAGGGGRWKNTLKEKCCYWYHPYIRRMISGDNFRRIYYFSRGEKSTEVGAVFLLLNETDLRLLFTYCTCSCVTIIIDAPGPYTFFT